MRLHYRTSRPVELYEGLDDSDCSRQLAQMLVAPVLPSELLARVSRARDQLGAEPYGYVVQHIRKLMPGMVQVISSKEYLVARGSIKASEKVIRTSLERL